MRVGRKEKESQLIFSSQRVVKMLPKLLLFLFILHTYQGDSSKEKAD